VKKNGVHTPKNAIMCSRHAKGCLNKNSAIGNSRSKNIDGAENKVAQAINIPA
jgi:hypothetical protein